ncbi:MAG: hypothetical protein JW724_06470 [Candidatus Altiarchaeota archaeon]|nr:hypothetical protein [Candidatus Altiarchaeota archaeon]
MERKSFIRFLRDKKGVFEEIKGGRNLNGIIFDATLVILFFSAIYGVVMGLFGGGFVLLMDMVKIPMILLVVLYASAPSYYVIAALIGLKTGFKQMVALLSVGYAVASTVLIAFTPVVFVYSVSENSNMVIHLVHYILFALAGMAGGYYLLSGMWALHGRESSRDLGWLLPLAVGGILTLLVGTKMVWILRPYFHFHQIFFEGLGVIL